MIPIPILLSMMAATGTLTDVASTAANLGGKVIKASLNAGVKASKVSFVFVKGGVEAIQGQGNADFGNHQVQKLTKPLSIIDSGLSIPASFYENQTVKINNEISDDLAVLKGQNEINFLSNSIRYFVDSHIGRTGIDRGISYALQYQGNRMSV